MRVTGCASKEKGFLNSQLITQKTWHINYLIEKNTVSKIKHLYIYTDGAARGNPGEAGAGIYIRDSLKILLEKGVYLGHTTNNVAEYIAFILGLKEAEKLGGNILSLYADSELLVNQIKGTYKVKDKKLKLLFDKAKKHLSKFIQYEIFYIKREENRDADRLANKAIDCKAGFNGQDKAIELIKSL